MASRGPNTTHKRTHDTITPTDARHIWKLRQGFTPQRTDCTADIINAIDIDTILSMQIRDWYINLLDNADIRYLVTTDISSRLTPQPHPSGTVTIHLPDGIRRITHIKLKGWQRPAAVIRADRDPALASRQANPHTRGGPVNPVAIHYPPDTVLLYTLPDDADPMIETATAVILPPENTYTLDPSALTLIPLPASIRSI